MRLEKFAFLKTKTFSRYYSITTTTVLGLNILFNFISITGNLAVQTISGFLLVLSVVLLIGQILLILKWVSRTDKIGAYLIRLSYVTLFVMMLAMLLVTSGQIIASFFILDENSMAANLVFSTLGMTSVSCFGVCLSGFYNYALSIDGLWN